VQCPSMIVIYSKVGLAGGRAGASDSARSRSPGPAGTVTVTPSRNRPALPGRAAAVTVLRHEVRVLVVRGRACGDSGTPISHQQTEVRLF
jgi:hypothetical protein